MLVCIKCGKTINSVVDVHEGMCSRCYRVKLATPTKEQEEFLSKLETWNEIRDMEIP